MTTPLDKVFSSPQIKSLFTAKLSWQTLGFRRKLSLLLYSVAFLSVTVIGFYGYQHASYAYRSRATDLIDGYTSEVAVKIQDFLQTGRNDLQFLNNLYFLRRYTYWRDIGDEKQMLYWQAITTDTLRNFSSAYDYVYKIRLLDIQGQELLGVRYDRVASSGRILAHDELYNEAQTDYFKEVQKLQHNNEVYVSPLDLNRERGVIEQPQVPIVRFATPMIGENGVRYGAIVYNVLAEKFFEFIHSANKNTQGRTFYLIDQQGQFLYHPDGTKMFGILLGHHASFEQDYPDILAKMRQNNGKGIIKNQSEIISYHPIYPNERKPDNYWLLVGVISEKAALSELNNFISVFALLFIGVTLLVVAANRYMLGQIVRPLEFVTQQLKKLSEGVAEKETLFYPAEDEIHQMLVSCELVVANIQSLTRQVDAIAKGNFNDTVETLSHRDLLGSAINNMTAMLRAARQEDQNRNWLRDGLEQLSSALTGDLTSTQLADLSISLLGRYLQAGRGVFYCYNSNVQLLELLGSYMYSERNQVGSCFKLGEGAIGQVAREKKPIFLTTLNLEQPPIVTGTSCSAPLYTYTYPLQREGNLLGVMELASFSAFDELKLLLLQKAAEIIASFLYVVQQREQIKNLLTVAETAEKEAREKSIRLQEANAQMEEQQQQLQQQTEELQQANAQMEEQQQQLQQQTEELQQTNAQMEEAQQQLEQQNRALVKSQQELDARSRQLELSSQYKSEFLANMSHELRTPLNSIILLSKMMQSNTEKHLSDEEVHHAEIIHNAGQELLRLINDVLDLSKVEAGRMDLHISSVSSQELLAELNEMFEHSAKDKNLEFILQDNLRGEFVSDANRLSQILRNLLSNAFKFTQKGSVTLSLKRISGAKLPIQISVKDTGMGIAPEKRKVIFEAFQQADGSISRQYGGTGLGLSISLRFAQLLGGTIEMNSIVGEGSEFSVLLPETLAEPQAVAVAKKTAYPGPAAVETPAPLPQIFALKTDDREQLTQQDSVILLIDDDPLFGQALLEINRKLGYKTLLANSGQEGLNLAKTYHPQGILLDLGLPDIDGSAVLHQIKSDPDLADTPVYVVSGREKDAALMQQGLLGYLQKPVNAEQIGQAEAQLLACIQKNVSQQIILMVENGSTSAEQIKKMIDPQIARVLPATVDTDMEVLLAGHSCCLAIVDLGIAATSQALKVAKKLRQINPNLNMVFVGLHSLSDEEDARLHQYSDSIIIKAAQSEQRLLKNIERFLNAASQNLENPVAGSVKEQNGDSQRLAGRHILVVDDDARNLFVITAALEKQGAKVSGVLSGKSALDFLQKQTVDLVFMDIMMPGMDGYQTIIALRRNPAMAAIPVVVLTAKSLPADRDQALAAGADDYLAKPADFDVLVNMAAVWCANKRGAKTNP